MKCEQKLLVETLRRFLPEDRQLSVMRMWWLSPIFSYEVTARKETVWWGRPSKEERSRDPVPWWFVSLHICPGLPSISLKGRGREIGRGEGRGSERWSKKQREDISSILFKPLFQIPVINNQTKFLTTARRPPPSLQPLSLERWPFFCLEACGILVPWPGMDPVPPMGKHEVLTTGPPGKSQDGPFKCVRDNFWKD